ncbi:GGDEF domain-containing protein [Achromobacter sp. GG226]|uniref:sensor domain-containing diguanylate cyclase n=1 Tax=Verticiella alkaliphila TaxID=2779529 RepID=UPI001C0C2550|nr:sensor domain-containing diguanylate cyclase [Verticiella sp. GG226]MBU4609103.1 GGDEF domain-containing protein [Verticiella sp. GG226]
MDAHPSFAPTPPYSDMFRIDLRRLILTLCLLSVAAAMLNGLYSSLVVQRDVLVQTTLETNRAYAAKLANTTRQMVDNARASLRYGADVFGGSRGDSLTARREVERLLNQSSFFNSVIVIDSTGVVRASTPGTTLAVGQRLATTEGVGALQRRESYVSEPYLASTGRWLLTLWEPAFSPDGVYQGMMVGSFYLHEDNILSALLGEQSSHDGSYVYVVDDSGKLIYHPVRARIGELIYDRNPAVRRVLHGEAGSMDLVNSQGIRMLAGFAPVPGVNWGVISQQAYDTAVMPLTDLMWRTVRNSLPLLIFVLVVIWWTSERIALPLRRMARVVRQLEGKRAAEMITSVNAWYFEAEQLRRALLTGLSSLQRVLAGLRQDSMTDALTGVLNRRGMDLVLDELFASRTPFAVVCFDVDHFKRVNDTYGHALGDSILRRVGEIARDSSRDDDVVCRAGGEEFLMLLPNSTQRDAEMVAERLRQAVADTAMPGGVPITISLGVAHWPASAETPAAAVHAADAAMYQAKHAGRNCMRAAALRRG